MGERSSEHIQRDIERTRAEMSETIEALERRLSPGELFDEFWGRIKSGDTGANVGETIRDHPVPLALMGLGLGWLAIEKATESRGPRPRSRPDPHGEGTYAKAEGRTGPYRGSDIIDPEHRYGDSGGIGGRVGEQVGELKDRVAELGGEARDRIAAAGGRVGERISGTGEHLTHGPDGAAAQDDGGGAGAAARARHLRQNADEQVRHARAAAQRRGSQLEQGFRSLLEDYPLALGAVSFGIGLAAGASVPTVEAEDELLGDTSDTLKEGIREVTRDTAARVREVASEGAHAATSEIRSTGRGDDLGTKAQRVVHAATSTVGEEARAQGLTPEAMKERGREVGERTVARAKDGASRASGTARSDTDATPPREDTPGPDRGSTGALFGDRDEGREGTDDR